MLDVMVRDRLVLYGARIVYEHRKANRKADSTRSIVDLGEATRWSDRSAAFTDTLRILLETKDENMVRDRIWDEVDRREREEALAT